MSPKGPGLPKSIWSRHTSCGLVSSAFLRVREISCYVVSTSATLGPCFSHLNLLLSEAAGFLAPSPTQPVTGCAQGGRVHAHGGGGTGAVYTSPQSIPGGILSAACILPSAWLPGAYREAGNRSFPAIEVRLECPPPPSLSALFPPPPHIVMLVRHLPPTPIVGPASHVFIFSCSPQNLLSRKALQTHYFHDGQNYRATSCFCGIWRWCGVTVLLCLNHSLYSWSPILSAVKWACLLPRGAMITRQWDLVKGAQALAPAVLTSRLWMLGVESLEFFVAGGISGSRRRDGIWPPGCL